MKPKPSGVTFSSGLLDSNLSVLSTSQALIPKQACEMCPDTPEVHARRRSGRGTQACNSLCQMKSIVVARHPYLIVSVC